MEDNQTRLFCNYKTLLKIVIEVCPFLRLASYYQCFIRNFAKTGAPIRDLLRKNKDTFWRTIAKIIVNEL